MTWPWNKSDYELRNIYIGMNWKTHPLGRPDRRQGPNASYLNSRAFAIRNKNRVLNCWMMNLKLGLCWWMNSARIATCYIHSRGQEIIIHKLYNEKTETNMASEKSSYYIHHMIFIYGSYSSRCNYHANTIHSSVFSAYQR